MSAKRSDRMRAVLSIVHDSDRVSLAALARDLGVSAATLRRDLAALEAQGLLVRTHGGARALDTESELPVRLRDTQFQYAKRGIGRRAAAMVPAGPYAIALSGGTTTAEVARALRGRAELTIVTNALTIAMECATSPQSKVIMAGGLVRSKSFEAVGPMAEGIFHSITVGTVFTGVDGISADGGTTTHDETEARTNNAMVTNARRVVVVADGSKIGQVRFAKMADLDLVDDLITDPSADAVELERIERAGVKIHVVEPVSEQ
ncbi:DeoR/GlpR transcriptional regulator [Rhodococcus xishaensis]|uniref:DeoR/GlpR transcriptional regulator n=2 Tax=Rhodococcus xishaensis TaxID=2487364 RepID=A0A438ANE2_9NOCA|nr:DeoR/GlpR transcriptional regulator [Rhodococcus xishaensis]